ncbi:hypothetical protein F4680DRAFT_442763 [Xylaria scruposa]|nr:hypothetical protein F4680DRAFT_442763 [Xylaria scruposa]
MSALARFHSFSRLPAKLRIMIWQEFSLPDRPYVHIVDHLPRSFFKFKVTTYPPITPIQIVEILAVAGVSREARDEVLQGREIVHYENLLDFASYFDDGPYGLIYEAQFPAFCVNWKKDLIYLTRIPDHATLAETLGHFQSLPLRRTQNLAFDITEHVRYRPGFTDDHESKIILELLFLDPVFKEELPELRHLVCAIPRGCSGLGSFAPDPRDFSMREWTELDLSNLDQVHEEKREWEFFKLDRDWLALMTEHPIDGTVYLILDERTLHFANLSHQTFKDGKTEAGFSVTTVLDHREIWNFDLSWMRSHWAESKPQVRYPLQVVCLKGNNTGSSSDE